MRTVGDVLTAFALGGVLGAFVTVVLLGFLGWLGVPL